jgi:hypothetical protein
MSNTETTKQMQNVAFKTLADFWNFLPPQEFKIVETLNTIILENILI